MQYMKIEINLNFIIVLFKSQYIIMIITDDYLFNCTQQI